MLVKYFNFFYRLSCCGYFCSIVSLMDPYICSVFSMWLEYPELLLLFLVACMCYLYPVLNVLPHCPMYLQIQWTL
jgi:hypothetical protein